MIARTETNRAENQGKLLAMKNSGMDMKKQWLSAHDERTSELCKTLDGQTVDLDDDFHARDWTGQSPPSHVNCRSTMIFIEKEDVEKKEIEQLRKEMVSKELEKTKIKSNELDLAIKEKEADIALRKENLLKKLEGNLDGGD